MMRRPAILAILVLLCACTFAGIQDTARAQEAATGTEPGAETGGAAAEALPTVTVLVPYEEPLRRLATVLGSLHYLRNLCGETGDDWREQMDSLIIADEASGDRREMLIAAFNNGYRSFSATHVQCTPTSIAAIDRFMAEGSALSDDILTRFKN